MLKQQDPKLNLLYRIARYHEDISIFRTAFAMIAGLIKAQKSEQALEVFEFFANSNIDEHFEFEEKNVFNLVLKLDKAQGTVLNELQTAHSAIRSLRESVKAKITHSVDNPTDPAELLKESALLFNAMEVHAQRETDLIVPLFDNNQAMNFLLGRSVVKYTIEKKDELPLDEIKGLIVDANTSNDTQIKEIHFPTFTRTAKNAVASNEGYEIVLVNRNLTKYIESGKAITCPIRYLSHGEMTIDEEKIPGWDSPDESKSLSEINKIIIASRIVSGLNKFFAG